MEKITEKIIGYRGLISGELMLYTSRILNQLGLKVLVCDCSPDKEIRYVIPECEEYRGIVNDCMEYGGTNVCTETNYTVNECTEYGGIMHNGGMFNDELIKQFDTVLINFGFAHTHNEMKRCNYFYYVTDMDKINIDKLLSIKPDINRMNKDHLLIQNVVQGGIAVYACADEVMKKLSISTCSFIRFNKKDLKIKSYAQYNNRFKFQDISRDLYDYLYFCIWNIYSAAYEKKQICKAIDIAMKG